MKSARLHLVCVLVVRADQMDQWIPQMHHPELEGPVSFRIHRRKYRIDSVRGSMLKVRGLNRYYRSERTGHPVRMRASQGEWVR